MTQQGVADPLAEQHPAANHHAADGAVGRLAQQHADLHHPADLVDPHRNRIDVHEGYVGADGLELIRGEPAGAGVELVAHVGGDRSWNPLRIGTGQVCI